MLCIVAYEFSVYNVSVALNTKLFIVKIVHPLGDIRLVEFHFVVGMSEQKTKQLCIFMIGSRCRDVGVEGRKG